METLETLKPKTLSEKNTEPTTLTITADKDKNLVIQPDQLDSKVGKQVKLHVTSDISLAKSYIALFEWDRAQLSDGLFPDGKTRYEQFVCPFDGERIRYYPVNGTVGADSRTLTFAPINDNPNGQSLEINYTLILILFSEDGEIVYVKDADPQMKIDPQ